jgi:hypothetical protein
MGQQEQQEAMALGQWQRSIIAIAIDQSDVGGRGAPTRSSFIPCVLFETSVNAKTKVRIKE